MKIRPAGADSFQAVRRTDMTYLIVTFCNFAKAPRKVEKKLIENLHKI